MGLTKKLTRVVSIFLTLLFGLGIQVHAMETTQVGYASKYITVKGNNMHLALYGKLDASGETFAVFNSSLILSTVRAVDAPSLSPYPNGSTITMLKLSSKDCARGLK